MGTVFAFFGIPGAGKSTLCRRFSELCGLPAIDTDALMTADEIAAVESGCYTQAMRLANIDRYSAEVRRLLDSGAGAIALADGLPNDVARSYLVESLWPSSVVFVLVETPPELWRARLAARSGNAVAIDVGSAEAYIREHWRGPAGDFDCERIVNGDDQGAVDAALRALSRHLPPSDLSRPAIMPA
jgi:predicted kinase